MFNKIPPVLDFDLLIFFFILFSQETYKSAEITFHCFLIWFKKHFEVLMSFQFLQKDRSTSYLQKDSRYSAFFLGRLKVLIIHFVHHNSNSKLPGGQPSNLHPWSPQVDFLSHQHQLSEPCNKTSRKGPNLLSRFFISFRLNLSARTLLLLENSLEASNTVKLKILSKNNMKIHLHYT